MANYKNIVPFIKKAEGGLSRKTSDSASSRPSPWVYNGVSGWHTNKGVTYSTFVSLAPKLGYEPSAANFFSMPDDIWGKIYKQGYWDQFSLDNMKSQAIADLLADSAWGSGVGGTLKMLKPYLKEKGYVVSTPAEAVAAINKLASGPNEKKIFEELVGVRKSFFISLNQPNNINGWLNRLADLKELGLAELSKKKLN